MIMFSSFSNSVAFWMFGQLPVDYALWFGSWSALGIIFSLYVLNKIVKKYNRASIIVFCLAFVNLCSCFVVPIVNIRFLVAQSEEGIPIWQFGKLC